MESRFSRAMGAAEGAAQLARLAQTSSSEVNASVVGRLVDKASQIASLNTSLARSAAGLAAKLRAVNRTLAAAAAEAADLARASVRVPGPRGPPGANGSCLRFDTGQVVACPLAAAAGCRDDSGRSVDWFAVMKRNNSFGYSVMTPSDDGFVRSPHSLSDGTRGAVSNTLRQVFGAAALSGVSRLLYSDQLPWGTVSSTFAHAKGVLAVDAELNGYWLVHSTPRFPTSPDDIGFYAGMPEHTKTYGQSFLCISVSGAAALRTIGDALFLNKARPYGANLTAAVAAVAPRLASVAERDFSREPACVNTTLTSAGGARFTVFAKSSYWDKELYADCVAPRLNTSSLLVESWIRGGASGPECGLNDVVDITSVSIAGWGWRATQDHSKWAVSGDGAVGCIGDINRMSSQSDRGGGTVCTSEGALGQALRSAVLGVSHSC